VGVKDALYDEVPAVASVPGAAQPKLPGIVLLLMPVAFPEAGLNVEVDSASPAMGIEEAIGQVMPVGVALFTVTATTCPDVTAPYKLVFVGVKVTLYEVDPPPGIVVDALSLLLQAKAPGTLAEPPDRIELLSI
jgi:hypothetical protein